MRLAVRTLSTLMLLAMVGQTAAGERGQGPLPLQIEEAWARRTPPMASVEQGSHGGSLGRPDQSALSLTVHNHGHAPEALLVVSSPVATSGELHQTVLQDGTMVMQPQTRFEIPAGGHLAMRAGAPT